MIPSLGWWVKESGIASVVGVAWTQSLAWELPYARVAAKKKKKKKKKEKPMWYVTTIPIFKATVRIKWVTV